MAPPGWPACAAFALAAAAALLAARARAHGHEIGSTSGGGGAGGPARPEAPPAPPPPAEEQERQPAEGSRDLRGAPPARAAHEEAIPRELVDKIPEREQRVLRFFLEYFAWSATPVDGVFINGGYVRDLLLEKQPDDLDISLCLVDCAENVTVGSILEDMPNFIESLGAETVRTRFGFDTFKSVDIQGDVTKDKNLDTAKAVFGYGDGGPPLDVDVMPTIGEETYDENDTHRIPTRDQRGTPLQDALRRDLTIGAMLINVQETGAADRSLTWTLLDYYGGLQDLREGVLRAPHPPEVDAGLILSSADLELARSVGLDAASPQELWWVKVLRDDPLRIVRVFRFAAKLDFRIHESFWKVLPFALDNLKAKVAGSRKLTEIVKLAKYGNNKIVELFMLCFRKRFVHDLEGTKTCLATGIFGGQDAAGVAHYLPPVDHFDKDRFLRVVSTAMPDASTLSQDEVVGSFLAVALYATRFKDHDRWEADNIAAGGLSVPEEAFDRACNGLSTSNDLRAAGMRLLSSYESLRVIRDAPEKAATPVDAIFGRRLPSQIGGDAGAEVGDEDPGATFCRLRTVWEVLGLAKQPVHFAHEVIVNMLANGSDLSQQAAPVVEAYLSALRDAPSTKISGKGVSGLREIPPHLRGGFLTSLHILCRLRGETRDLDAPNALRDFLDASCESLLADLVAEWYEEGPDGDLKPKYRSGNAKKASKKTKKKGKK